MRRVVGAVCIGHKSGSTNFLSKATANKVSRRALLNHMFRLRSTASLRCKHCHFVVPLLRWRRLLRILCVHKTSHLRKSQVGSILYLLFTFSLFCIFLFRPSDLLHFIKLFGGKAGLGNRKIFLGEAEIGKFVVAYSYYVAYLIPIIIGI